MTAQHELDLNGTLKSHPLAELLVEISQARLNGSLRVSNSERKIVIYFHSGELIYAISNARAFRLFDILLRENKIDKEFLTSNPNFTNDLELAKALNIRGILDQDETSALFSEQIAGILKDAITWETGSWSFSPLARLRDGIRFKVNVSKLLFEYARTMTLKAVVERFKSLRETFSLRSEIDPELNLNPHEAFVMTRFSDSPLTIDEVKLLSGMPDTATFHTLYTLWLGGQLLRNGWNAAFTEHKIVAIKSAKLELKKEAAFLETVKPVEQATAATERPQEAPAPEPEPIVEESIQLEEYLSRSENAKTHYEMLGIEVKAEASEIKQAYFNLAKRFHPDHFHHEADVKVMGRVQGAFTKLAQAYDMLKNADSREAYDFRMRKELAEQERRAASGASKEEINKQVQAEQAAELFEHGFSLLMDEEYEAATPYLARAVFLASDSAKYHAYYGKALSADETQRHKAESEMQLAIKMDSTNATFRLILAEFFIQMNMQRRAEGELTRLLQIFPSNREAKTLLDSVRKK